MPLPLPFVETHTNYTSQGATVVTRALEHADESVRMVTLAEPWLGGGGGGGEREGG